MLVFVTARSSAATFPVARVDSVPPVAGRAGRLRSLTDGAGSRQRSALSRKLMKQPEVWSEAVRLAQRIRRQKAAGGPCTYL